MSLKYRFWLQKKGQNWRKKKLTTFLHQFSDLFYVYDRTTPNKNDQRQSHLWGRGDQTTNPRGNSCFVKWPAPKKSPPQKKQFFLENRVFYPTIFVNHFSKAKTLYFQLQKNYGHTTIWLWKYSWFCKPCPLNLCVLRVSVNLSEWLLVSIRVY